MAVERAVVSRGCRCTQFVTARWETGTFADQPAVWWKAWGNLPAGLCCALHTGCTHFLPIQFLPNARYLLANHEIQLDGFFDLFD